MNRIQQSVLDAFDLKCRFYDTELNYETAPDFYTVENLQ